jgi:MFS transporter, PPP family, 3-phenylpropionic acid transporter
MTRGGLAARAFYLCYFAVTASVLPYLALFYEALGFRGAQIGVLSGLFPFALSLGIFLWSGLSDLLGRPRALLTALHVGGLLGLLALSFSTSYPALLVAVGVFAGCFGAVVPIVDSAVLHGLGARKDRYGSLRVWGVVGYGASAPLVGRLTESYGLQSAFWVAAALLVLCLAAVYRLDFAQEGTALALNPAAFASKPWLIFLGLAFAGGLGLAVCSTYVYLYLSALGASRTVVGLSLTAATLAELPATLLLGALLRRAPPPTLLLGALALLGIRLLLYPVAQNVPWVLGVQLLHGVTFSVILIAGVTYADQLAPPRLRASAQGLFSATMTGLGGAAGGLGGGLLYGAVGVPALFTLVGAPLLGVALAFFAFRRRFGPPRAGLS